MSKNKFCQPEVVKLFKGSQEDRPVVVSNVGRQYKSPVDGLGQCQHADEMRGL